MMTHDGKKGRMTSSKAKPYTPHLKFDPKEELSIPAPYKLYSVRGPLKAIAGQSIIVRWTAAPDHSLLDWIGVYPVGAPDVPHLISSYVGKTAESGFLHFSLPADASGEWELRFFQKNSTNLMVKSLPFTVS